MNVTAKVLSPTSVSLRWLPGNADLWNGIITSYTIHYTLLRQVSATEQASESMTLVSRLPSSQLSNNPDPVLVRSPLTWEETVVEGLQAYYVYSFSVSCENSAGRSPNSGAVELDLPFSGEDKCYVVITMLTTT